MNSLKLFLTSGVTLTVDSTDLVMLGDTEVTTFQLYDEINMIMTNDYNEPVEFTVHMNVDDVQYIHHYSVMGERISWMMIEEVEGE